ncbi:hypothetical protein PHLH8_20920 [Pseudomonas sp. Pc102]|uniref:hypothetical protein n=1 Tax=Pseudomonas sp. Pc102 TaxID=2678261 RepID=UPI001BD0DE35|nr:hypothetical protein [Pseudomonas sp. Pc102]BBP82450.1 hypothetical protein PHLH8_20920 [Pseudomonas sp. Pc102]
MNHFIHRMLGHYLMDAATDGGDGGGQQEGTQEPQGSVLSQGANQDFIPEKYRVTGADGKLDLEQSSRKLAESYKHLETRMGSGDAPPKSFEEYAPKIDIADFNWDEFKADEVTQSFLKGAHAKGMTNAQVEFAVDHFVKNVAPQLLAGNAQVTAEEATSQLREAWKSDQEFTANLQASHRGLVGFANPSGLGTAAALEAKFGNDPDFIAFMANIGREMREDVSPSQGAPVDSADFAVKTSELRQQLQDLPAHDPKRVTIQQQLDALYSARYDKNSRFK